MQDQHEASDASRKAFKFADARDQVGLPVEHVAYAKRSCNNCYGRGYVTKIIGNGYAGGLAIKPREHDLCGCLHRGYNKVRRAFDEEVVKRVREGAAVDAALVTTRAAVYGRLFPGLDPEPQQPALTVDGQPIKD